MGEKLSTFNFQFSTPVSTPIYNFAAAYAADSPARFHMPGHKGRGPLGCEALDITEIPGADSLYEAAGIIAESEANASALFGCPTFYSTEGSSQCIRAMLFLASLAMPAISRPDPEPDSGWPADRSCSAGNLPAGRFRVLAARNVHRAFLSAAALLDLDVVWLPAGEDSYLSAHPDPAALDRALAQTGAGAVYLSCPDYLGELPALGPLAGVCHARGALLLVDNAHGAYLRFLTPSRHPIDLGADLCCDSAHKTLPVLTGGAYLHLAQNFPPEFVRSAKDALALFGSTSPSYLILQSLDLANPYLQTLPERLSAFLPKLEGLKARLAAAGWRLCGDEPLKLCLDLRGSALRGTALAAALGREGIFCEFADPDFVVFMFSPENTDAELERLENALLRDQGSGIRDQFCSAGDLPAGREKLPERVCRIRQAMLSPCERIPARLALGRVLARPGVSCPPAVPILMPGERIDAAALAALVRYGIEAVDVLPQTP